MKCVSQLNGNTSPFCVAYGRIGLIPLDRMIDQHRSRTDNESSKHVIPIETHGPTDIETRVRGRQECTRLLTGENESSILSGPTNNTTRSMTGKCCRGFDSRSYKAVHEVQLLGFLSWSSLKAASAVAITTIQKLCSRPRKVREQPVVSADRSCTTKQWFLFSLEEQPDWRRGALGKRLSPGNRALRVRISPLPLWPGPVLVSGDRL
jgi:hypothetical protein